ncbi:hypothetical protein ABZ642_15360 [Streptomyces sp. NPDC007157]|uniref:hypothetical protein n=1 Tax=Streptomyces sp. NPDC007157 TaxID=3154681 RepID=UPI0033E9B0A7
MRRQRGQHVLVHEIRRPGGVRQAAHDAVGALGGLGQTGHAHGPVGACDPNRAADTIIVPGFEHFQRPPRPRVRAALKLAGRAGIRIASTADRGARGLAAKATLA